MADINKSIVQITSLEELASKKTFIHKLNPRVKVLTTIIYLVFVISFSPYRISGLIPFILYPLIIMMIGDIPFTTLGKRLLIALPFTLFTGISGCIFDKDIVFYLGDIGITQGVLSFGSILLKTVLTVMAVLLLIATTTMNDLIYTLIQFRIPSILTLQLMMTYRYIHVLLSEISTMYHAYKLRAPRAKGIKLKDMSSFLGQLIIRSFDRAERIYNAMKCRGFEGDIVFTKKEKITYIGWIYMIGSCTLFLFLRFVNVSELIGRILLQ